MAATAQFQVARPLLIDISSIGLDIPTSIGGKLLHSDRSCRAASTRPAIKSVFVAKDRQNGGNIK